MTAVQWLIEKLYQHEYHIDILDVATMNGYFKQAEEMHKKEIIDALNEFSNETLSDEFCMKYYNKI
jgi:hypothetical protein